MTRPRAADDFTTIRARMEELRREREHGPVREDGRARARTGDGDRRRRERLESWPPPWMPTIFVRRPRG